MSNKNNNKTVLILLLVVFVVPVIMAKFALEFDWFNKASTNRGQLLEPTIVADQLLQGAETKWHFLYVIPEVCEQACENAIYSVSQVKTAIGRESDRVNSIFIATANSDKTALQTVAEITDTQVLHKEQENVNEVFKDVDVNGIFIADTLNNIVLKFPTAVDKEQAIMDSRDMLSDMKKLLKLSRIG